MPDTLGDLGPRVLGDNISDGGGVGSRFAYNDSFTTYEMYPLEHSRIKGFT